jgi:hypothetical protein
MQMGGRTMKGFIRVAPEGYRTEASLRKWLERGLDFASTLPRTASRRRKS